MLLTATTVWDMTEAAKMLRLTATGVGRMLTRPVSMGTSLQFDPSVADPERRRMELADLAVDVVTAVDYLLSLLECSTARSSPLILGDEAGVGSGHDISDQGAYDRLVRRRFDARGNAVRLGMRLLGRLGCDVAYHSLDSSVPDSSPARCAVSCLFGEAPPAEGAF